MAAQATRDTGAELELRRELHSRGLRYRVNFRPDPTLRRSADIVFTRARVAVFVDGCFWHACPEHGTVPKANRDWWNAKLTANTARDRDTDSALRAAGWSVVRCWEHDDPRQVADLVEQVVRKEPQRSGYEGNLRRPKSESMAARRMVSK
ncbi:MAG: very short patch repair endonuclease [Candidatus Nanopelagicales bacterium]|nr:very short patch repair endonuclease [Candidatus Nanopelagicales bacterium]